MAQLRFDALKKLSDRQRVHVDLPGPVSKFYGENVFGMEQMRASLSPAVFKKVSQAIKNHEKIDETSADAVASAAKLWAMSKSASSELQRELWIVFSLVGSMDGNPGSNVR